MLTAFRAKDRLLKFRPSAGSAKPHRAACTRRVSATSPAPTTGEVVREFQADSSRGDARDGVGRSHDPESLDEREQWFVWIAAAVVVTRVLAAIGYVAMAGFSEAAVRPLRGANPRARFTISGDIAVCAQCADAVRSLPIART
jgi:hypothetical protein